jgi:hypothetical protein
MVTDSVIGLMWVLCGASMVAALIALLSAKPRSNKASTTGELELGRPGSQPAAKEGLLS